MAENGKPRITTDMIITVPKRARNPFSNEKYSFFNMPGYGRYAGYDIEVPSYKVKRLISKDDDTQVIGYMFRLVKGEKVTLSSLEMMSDKKITLSELTSELQGKSGYRCDKVKTFDQDMFFDK